MSSQNKICTTCGESKPLNDFHKSSKGALGRKSSCATCCKAWKKVYYEKNKAFVLAATSAYQKLNVERSRVWKRNYERRNAASLAEKKRAYERLNKHIISAHGKVAWALKTGKLTKQPCEVCGAIDSEAHHDDYSKPLDVRWLCSPHHNQHHNCKGPKDECSSSTTETTSTTPAEVVATGSESYW